MIASELFKIPKNFDVEIVSFGDSNLNDPRFKEISIRDTIKGLSDDGKLSYFKTQNPSKVEIEKVINRYKEQVGHEVRPHFDGNIIELGLLSAKDCLDKGNILPRDIGKFTFVSNTVPFNEGYPSSADNLMEKLSDLYPGPEGISNGYASFSQEACSIGVIAVMEEAQNIYAYHEQSNYFNKKGRLIIASELATKLAHPDEFIFMNLFGDGSGSVFIRPGKCSFLGMGAKTNPYLNAEFSTSIKAKDLIRQNGDGTLYQNGRSVHKWVNSSVVIELKQAFEEIDFDYRTIKHAVFHQPSKKVIDTFRETINEKWPGFTGEIYWEKNTGNTSSASTLSLMSRLLDSGTIKPGEIVLVAAFGAGLTWAFYICIAPDQKTK